MDPKVKENEQCKAYFDALTLFEEEVHENPYKKEDYENNKKVREKLVEYDKLNIEIFGYGELIRRYIERIDEANSCYEERLLNNTTRD